MNGRRYRLDAVAVIDLETAGLSPTIGDRTTEIAVVLAPAGGSSTAAIA